MRWRENSRGDELIKQNNEMLWNSREKVARRYIALELNIHFCVLWQSDVLFGRLLSWGGYMLAFVSFLKNNTYFLKHEFKRKKCVWGVFLKNEFGFSFSLQVACLAANYLKGLLFFFFTSWERKVIFFFKMRLCLHERHLLKPISWCLLNRNPKKNFNPLPAGMWWLYMWLYFSLFWNWRPFLEGT